MDGEMEAEWSAQKVGWLRGGDASEKVEAPPPSLVIRNPSLLAGVAVPPRRWMVPEWMPWQTTTALYGDGGVGKSLLAQMLGSSAAAGRPWLGLDVAHCPAFGVFCEDDDEELHRRQADINAALGIDWPDLRQFRWMSRVGLDNALMIFSRSGIGELRPFWHQIREAARDQDSKLLILDTAADLFAGNENDRGQVRQFIQGACTRLAIEIDGAVLLCAHPSRTGLANGNGDGGNTAWNNSVRARWYLSRPEVEEKGASPDTRARILSRKKANYSGIGDDVALEWDLGFFRVASGLATDVASRIERHNREMATECAILVCLRAMIAEGRAVSHSANAKNYAPKVMFGRRELNGASRPEIERAMNRLFEAKAIEANMVIGRSAGRKKLIGIAPVEPPEKGEDNVE